MNKKKKFKAGDLLVLRRGKFLVAYNDSDTETVYSIYINDPPLPKTILFLGESKVLDDDSKPWLAHGTRLCAVLIGGRKQWIIEEELYTNFGLVAV